jgi:ABC-type nickel/cobalt efflux system permease component RcnA
VDVAELPTLQERAAVDGDGNGAASDAERSTYARRTCGAVAGGLTVAAGGHRVSWTLGRTTFEYLPGAAGLSTSRLECHLSGAASLDSRTVVTVDNRFRSDRIGWREMTAVGHGVRLLHSPLPATSVSNGLRAYPKDLLTSPLDVRSARITVEPGSGASSVASATPTASQGGVTRFFAHAESALEGLAGGRHLTPLVGALAVLLAIALGAGHAALPGHGKTVMAVYLTGQAGRARDALAVAATVTITHTGGVLVLGLLLTTAASVAGEQVLGWLGVASGATVAAVGIVMVHAALRRVRGARNDGGTVTHDHADGRSHGHDHGPGGSHHHEPHTTVHAHGHHHGRRDGGHRLSIVGMGIAGGLVPSPSALVILLGSIGLGRTGFGVMLVIGYGLGMAGMLTAAGLTLVALRRRSAHRLTRVGNRWTRLARLAPTSTAVLVLLVGVGLCGRALAAVA